MDITVEAKLLTAVSRPYDFNGKPGVSHKVRFLINDEIFVAKSSAEQVLRIASLAGQSGEAVFKISSPKEALALTLVSFTA